jgi:hypothetical protein
VPGITANKKTRNNKEEKRCKMKWERWKAYIEVCRDATSDSSTEQTSLNKALLCSSHSHRLSISLCVCLSLSSQPASLVSFSLSALLFSPQLSTLLYCLWKLGWRLFSAYFFCMQIVLYHQHLSCSLVTNDSPPHPPFFPFFWTKQMPEANANGKSTILIHNPALGKSCDKDGVQR